MPIDTSIYNALIRPKSVGDYLAEYDERDLRDQQRQVNALALQSGRQKQQDYERDQQEYGLVQNVLAGMGAGATDEQRANALYGTGTRYGMTQAEAIRKQMIEQQKARAEALTKFYDAQGRRATRVMAAPSLESAMSALAEMQMIAQQLGIPVDFEAEAQAVQKLRTPEDFYRWAAGHELTAKDMLSKGEVRNMGGTDQAFTTDFMGRVTPGQTFQKTATPDARLSAGTAAERLKFDREKFNAEQTGGSPALLDAGGVSQAPLVKMYGKPSAGFRWKPDGSQEPIPGGPADEKKRSSEMGKGTVSDVIASLRMLYDDLDKNAGITNPDRGAFANMTAGIASSETGQAAGRLFGTENQSKRNTIAQQRPLLLQAIMKATGMSAKQMDSNAELKLYLATATDPTLDVATNKRALDMIESLYGVGGTGEKPAAPGAGPKKINNDAEYDALPSGAEYIAPDGSTRRKK